MQINTHIESKHRNSLCGAGLSDREYQAFEKLVAGNSVTDIAERLNLSVKTGQAPSLEIARGPN